MVYNDIIYIYIQYNIYNHLTVLRNPGMMVRRGNYPQYFPNDSLISALFPRNIDNNKRIPKNGSNFKKLNLDCFKQIITLDHVWTI